MQQSIHDFQNLSKKENNYISNENLKEIFNKFDFIFYPDILQTEKKGKQFEDNSKIIIIDECIENDIKYYIVCFDYKLIILPQEGKTDNSIISSIFTKFEDSDKYFIQNSSIQFETNISNVNFFNEIRNFSKEFIISNERMQNFWRKVVNCLCGFLIKKGYQNSRNRHEKYINEKFVEYKEEHKNIINKSYIKIRDLGYGSGGKVELIYHILKEEVFALKLPYIESQHLIERERRNYLSIRHPFIVPYIGYIKLADNPKYLLLEYIEGETLDKYNLPNLNDEEKCFIILELLLTFHYLHSHKYIYRDLRFSNIMINQNKDAILIDFDHVTKENDETEDEVQTYNFIDQVVLPEKCKTYESDVYLLSYIIYFILYEKYPKLIKNKMETNEDFIFKSCLKNDPTERPNIINMTNIFLVKFKFKNKKKELYLIFLAANQNIPQAQFIHGAFYFEGRYVTRDINKAIHYYTLAANNYISDAQVNLGIIYCEGRYVTQNINKAIHYFTLAANNNIPGAQFNLGLIYDEGRYVERDINKAIHYYSLAANQNFLDAQLNLGDIYHEKRDINKAIHYFSLAANQKDPSAQFNLGVIYFAKRDINKAIHYFSLAANQNHSEAQFNLGVIYHDGRYASRDINKAIHYFSLAASQNHPRAQFRLGVFILEGRYVTRDINNAIHYFSLAANNNIPEAQLNLGLIYYEGRYVARDINNAIHYYTLAANNNIPEAQFNLGVIYCEGRYVIQNISKAIHYFTLAANNNFPEAQINLGAIYHEGRYVTQNINKAIHYFTLAANNNISGAQFNLGIVYHKKQDINKAIHYYTLAANNNFPEAQFNLALLYDERQDINKAIHYFSLAANHNIPEAQLCLGLIYYFGMYVKLDIKKGSNYIMLASMNNNRNANFFHGFLFHEGKCVKKDILEAIHYYKEASSFNNQYSKNNLGIIYKHGFNDIEGKACNAIVYFEEAIKQKNDYLSMYNLAHIYMYDVKNTDLPKSIDLLIKSIYYFQHSFILLCLALLKQFNFNIETIKNELKKRTDVTGKSMDDILKEVVLFKSSFDKLYELYRHKDFLYSIKLEPIESSELEDNKKIVPPKYPNAKDLSSEFYKGFGEDLYAQLETI